MPDTAQPDESSRSMELQNRFTVPVPVDEAWQVMLDVARLGPCMPGATVEELRGDDVLGRVKVKLGPIVITYKGRLTFVERDADRHRVVLDAAAREMRGSGTASARITAAMEAVDGGATEVSVTTDLNITGKPAQFGRNVMADVSERIIDEFAANLARELEGRSPQPAVQAESSERVKPPAADGSAPVRTAVRPSAEALDLLGAARAPVLKRLVPVLAAVLAGLAVLAVRRGRRYGSACRR
jgi:carbon monoxide dehydrogenase subunit G